MKTRPQLPDQNHVLFSPRAYLDRATWWLTSPDAPAISYASLELRFTFEAIVVNHGGASQNESKSFAKSIWQPKDLFATLRTEFAPVIDITKSYRFYLDTSDAGARIVVQAGLQQLEADNTLTTGYFLALPEELFSLYGQLSENLHATWAGRDMRLPERPWYTTQHRFLSSLAYRLLPHTHSKNSLNHFYSNIMKFEEIDSVKLEQLLRDDRA